MKKIKAVFTLCAMVLVLCGCSMKTEYGMSIKNDKSMDFSVLMAFDNELIDGMLSMESESGEQTEYTDEQRWAMIESSNESEEAPEDYGFTETRYEEGEYKGFKYVKKISNIDDISGDVANFKLEEFQNISDSIVFVKDGDKYKASFVLSSEEQSSSTQGYDIGIEMKFVVTLPNKPISHNATEVSEDGKTLTWNLLDSSSQNIEFEFSFKNNTLLYIGIAIGAVIVISAIIGVFVSKNKKGNKGDGVVTPVGDSNQTNENLPNFLQPTSEQPQVAPTQPVMEQPQVAPTQPVMEQPQVAPTQPVMEQPQVAPAQPVMEQPQVVPTQPTMPTQQELPSVADILGLPQQDNQSNNQ